MNLEHISVGHFFTFLAIILGISGAIVLLIRAGMGSRADAERARLFEMGYYLPRRSSRWPQSLFCTAMGLGVPMTALAFASDRGAPPEAWIVACVISVAAVVGATIVAALVFYRTEPSGQPEKLDPNHSKPASDPDALDFAGRLGRG